MEGRSSRPFLIAEIGRKTPKALQRQEQKDSRRRSLVPVPGEAISGDYVATFSIMPPRFFLPQAESCSEFEIRKIRRWEKSRGDCSNDQHDCDHSRHSLFLVRPKCDNLQAFPAHDHQTGTLCLTLIEE